MKKKGSRNDILVVKKQEYPQNLIWKITTDDVVSKLPNCFKVEVSEGCEILYHNSNRGTEPKGEGIHTFDKQQNIVSARGSLYGVDVTPFEIVCGVGDVSYTDYRYGKDTVVGIYAKSKVKINNAKELYEKLMGSSDTLSIEKVKEAVSEELKRSLKRWLFETIKNKPQNEVDIKCADNIKSLDEAFNNILTECGLMLLENSLSVGQVKFDDNYINEKKDKEKLEEQEQIDEKKRLLEKKRQAEEIDTINSLQSNKNNEDPEKEITAFCPKCKRNFDRGYNNCPYCGITLKK